MDITPENMSFLGPQKEEKWALFLYSGILETSLVSITNLREASDRNPHLDFLGVFVVVVFCLTFNLLAFS